MAGRRTPYRARTLAKRGRQQLGGASCSTSPRWVRGGIGLLFGSVLGGMLGGGVAMMLVNSATITEPLQSAIRLKSATMIPILGAVVGGAGVGIFAAAKPECGT